MIQPKEEEFKKKAAEIMHKELAKKGIFILFRDEFYEAVIKIGKLYHEMEIEDAL